MNLLLVLPEEVRDHRVDLADRRAEHITLQLKKPLGAELALGVLGQSVGKAKIVAREGRTVTLELLEQTPSPKPTTCLVLALPRPKALSRLVQQAASFGIARLILTRSSKVESSYFSSKRLLPDRLKQDLLLGLEQGGWVHLPEFETCGSLFDLKARLGPGTRAERRVVMHPRASTWIHDVDAPLEGSAWTLFIGPDGGLLDSEVDHLGELGFRPVTLGPGILRTEAAVCAALGQLALRLHLP